jgi:hypothetical protein
MGSGGLRAGGRRKLAWFSQWSMSVLRCSRQQTLFMSFCEASEECEERILRRSSQRFSTTRNHPAWRRVSRPQTEQGERFVIGVSIGVLLASSQALTRGSGQEAWTRALVEEDGQHPLGGVKTEREVRGGVAEPEMFTSAELPPVAVESAAGVRRQSFRQE